MDVKKLSLENRASMCNGIDSWHTKNVEGLDNIMVSDGPHGLRKENKDAVTGAIEKVAATNFPAQAGLACSWNKELIGEVGKTIAKEAKAEQVSVLLGPGVNMKRSPLCGRNFEYFSEDPYLAGKLAVAYVNGVQGEGIGTSLKHFAVNSQETRRFTIDEIVSERALREIYLPAFEMVVKEAQPKTVMASYNMLNGEHTCESKEVTFTLSKRAFAYWDEYEGMCRVPTGKYKVLVGSSSADTPLCAEIYIEEKNPICHLITLEMPYGALSTNPAYNGVYEEFVNATVPLEAVRNALFKPEAREYAIDSKNQNYTPRMSIYSKHGYPLEDIKKAIDEANKKLGF